MRSLTFKLTLAFLVVSLTGIALVAVLVWGITSSEFNRFLLDRGLNEYTTAATNYYKTHGSWVGLADSLRQQNIIQTLSPDQSHGGGNHGQGPTPFALVDLNNVVVAPAGPFQMGEQVSADRPQQKIAITVNNKVVGYVLTFGGRPPNPDPIEARYLLRTNQALILAALGAVVIAVLLGLFLARTLTRPIRDLTLATSAMAEGRLNQQVQVRSKDELGELTKTFNKMSADLEYANRLRQQMTADIAHDLRTPLSVITGYLEGLKDGVIKPSPKRFTAMYDEAIFLQRLVEDLRTLSLADAGELSINYQVTQPGELIERVAASFQRQAEINEIELSTLIDADLPPVRMDPERMMQAMGNLVSNAMRYTHNGGKIVLSARRADNYVCFEVKDNGTGIDAEMLPHVFERFYRGDDSRQEGGSGLGLAITKSIVELQGGKVSATSHGSGSGSLFSIQLPCSS